MTTGDPTALTVKQLDAAAMRALAHPLRMRMVGLLRAEGPATASGLAERLGVSSGLTSYHLRALADAAWWRSAIRRRKSGSREICQPPVVASRSRSGLFSILHPRASAAPRRGCKRGVSNGCFA